MEDVYDVAAEAQRQDVVRPRVAVEARTDAQSERVQTLRGLACLLLVAFHVIVDNSVTGVDPKPDSVYQSLATLFAHLRMPLFIFLSGYVYAHRPAKLSSGHKFIAKKIQRLLIPFLSVTTLFLIFQFATGTNRPGQDISSVYLYTFAHLWFLQALMLIFAVVFVLEIGGAMRTFQRYLAVMALALLAHFFVKIHHNLFSINQAIYLLPFFLAGIGANRFQDQFAQPRIQTKIVALFVFAMSMHALAVFDIFGSVPEQRTVLATTLSLAGCMTLIYWMPTVEWLGRIGQFSFAIYLLHVFFTTLSRMALGNAGIIDPLVFFWTGLICGVGGPVVMEALIKRQPFARRLVLGQA